jgi:hypothetical protein
MRHWNDKSEAKELQLDGGNYHHCHHVEVDDASTAASAAPRIV